MTRWRVIGLSAALVATVSTYARAARADTVTQVYVCGEAVDVQFSNGTTTYWMFIDTSDGVTTQKKVDRYYALILLMLGTGKGASVMAGPTGILPCVGTTVNRLSALQVYY